jgi:hypothetical protein
MIVSFCVRGTGRSRSLASLGGRGFILDGGINYAFILRAQVCQEQIFGSAWIA